MKKKKVWHWMAFTAAGCAAFLGASAVSLPVHAMSSVEPPAIVTAKGPAGVIAVHGVKVQEKLIPAATEYLTTNIKVPQLTGMLDKQYQDELNDIILSHAEKDLAQWKQDAADAAAKAKMGHREFRPYDLCVSYHLKSDGTGSPAELISLEVITEGSTGGTSMPRIDTYNVTNSAAAARVTLSSLLGEDYKNRLDADILAQMKKEPEKYFLEDYKGTVEEQTFYIENGELVIVFPKYSIAPGYVGSPEFRFDLKGQSVHEAKR